MHDPMTVAFEIKYPWRGRPTKHEPKGYRDTFITFWHKDPERHGNDDSCDWFGKYRPLNARERALWDALDDLFHTLGNAPYYPDPRLYGRTPHSEDGTGQGPVKKAQRAMYAWRRRSRWRLPVRWHVWHWRIQIHPLQHFKRWAFSRCRYCGGRFSWGYCPIGYSWGGYGPAWFRNAERVAHHECDARQVAEGAAVGSES